MKPSPLHAVKQQGASLIVSLLMLTVILLLGISATQLTLQSEQASRNDRDRQIAFQAAEAALIDAQMDLEGSRKKHVFPKNSRVGFSANCTDSGDYLGLCKASDPGQQPVWEKIDFLKETPSVAYGKFTGRVFQGGRGLLPARMPRYIIESLSYIKAGEELNSTMYRITSIGFGMKTTTQVVLQTIYRKEGTDTINENTDTRTTP
jgi:type IV pilus assembly protein PilX